MDNNSNMILDEMMIEKWDKIVQEELTSILMLVKNFGNEMARSKGGVILNILSDLYFNPRGNIVGLMQNVKDISLIALTNGLVGLTKYISTYWNERCVRSNSLTIGASEENSFLETHREDLLNQIPIGRFANNDEFKAAVIFLVSDASSYLTGENIVINGGRTCW